MAESFVARGRGGYDWPVEDGVEARFWRKVDKGGEDDCWEWTAYRSQTGYGYIRNGGRMAAVHRLSYVFAHGRIPDGAHVLHDCDNPSCVNPRHLHVGTHQDNMREMSQRGRTPKVTPWRQGEKHPLTSLTNDDVRDIRSRAPHENNRALAREYGITAAALCNIVKRKRWQYLD